MLQVRAQTLQELVYKQGSAGITKATVSIVFHNDDPKNGPSGYDDKEYITVTRQVGWQHIRNSIACLPWLSSHVYSAAALAVMSDAFYVLDKQPRCFEAVILLECCMI